MREKIIEKKKGVIYDEDLFTTVPICVYFSRLFVGAKKLAVDFTNLVVLFRSLKKFLREL